MTHFRTCDQCEAMCGLAIEHDGERVLAIEGDPLDPLSRGFLCDKAHELGRVHEDPRRLRTPMRRDGDRLTPTSWDDALEDIARRIHAIQKQHGHDAIATYYGAPIAHDHGLLLFLALLVDTLRTSSRYSMTSVDALPHLLTAYLLYGHQALIPVPDLDRTQYFLIIGANPVLSHGSLMSAPDLPRRLAELRARGGRVVVLDPRRGETAALADRHLFIRPGSDALFLMAVVHTLLSEELAAPGRLAEFTDGIPALQGLAAPFTPEAVAAATGVAAADTRGIARELAAAPAAAVYGRMGVATAPFGALSCWLIHAVNLLTGNLDRAGGVMFAHAAVDMLDVANKVGEQGSYATATSRVRGLPEFGGEWPAATLADEIETPGPGQLRGLVVVAGNPVLTIPNGRRLERALAGLDLLIAVDPYETATSRLAHFILPPTSPLERSHFDMLLGMFAVRAVVKHSPALFAPPPGARHDWQILLELSQRVAAQRGFFGSKVGAASRALMGRLGPDGLVNWALKLGPHKGLSLDKVAAAPHGLDLGPLLPCLPRRLHTPRRRIPLVPPALAADVPRLRAALETAPPPLALIRGQPKTTLILHPSDAAARGLGAGQRVRVSTQAGALELPLELSEDVMPGVCALPHASARARLNDLTDEQRLDAVGGTAAVCATPVTIVATSETIGPRSDH